MAIGTVNYGTLRVRQGSPAAMSSANPVLGIGEFGQSVSGTDVVLKVGDGVTAWNSLDPILPHPEDGGGGGGGALATCEGVATALTQGAGSGGSTVATINAWTFTDKEGSVGAVSGAFGWGYTEAGFYQVTVHLNVGFDSGTPDFVNVQLAAYLATFGEIETDVPCYPSGVHGRSKHGTYASITSPIYYQPALAETGTDDSAHQLVLSWLGGGDITNGNSSGTVGAVVLTIARVG